MPNKSSQNFVLILVAAFLTLSLATTQAHAWGKRGHAMVCETAAYLVVEKTKKTEFLKDHSYDLGFYCNVPDVVWKREATYKREWFNHFMDMEIFDREFKGSNVEKPFELSRLEFEKAFPNVKETAGRSFWRINELMQSADKISAELKKSTLSKEERQKLQADWLVNVGVLGHYIGDLSQPLHVTENYDGQMSEQKGVHSWFEDEVVNQLFLQGAKGLEFEVLKSAELKWKKLNGKWDNKPVVTVAQDLANDSNKELANLLKIDKRIGRKSIQKAAAAYHNMIVDRMATGAVALATLWSREVGWDYDGMKFHTFVTDPEYIAYPTVPTPVAQPAKP